MTEAEWLACGNPSLMLEFLRIRTGRAKLGRLLSKLEVERKLRLFLVGCCRHIWTLLTDPRSRRAVEVAEQYADGVAK